MIDTEDLLSKPFWIIDILPKQVLADAGRQYFKIEKYFLTPPHVDAIYQKFADVLLKLNCYYNIMVRVVDDDKWIENPAPEDLTQMMLEHKQLNVILKNQKTMISISGDDHYITLYNPDKETLELINSLATAEGLHVWKHENIS